LSGGFFFLLMDDLPFLYLFCRRKDNHIFLFGNGLFAALGWSLLVDLLTVAYEDIIFVSWDEAGHGYVCG